MPTFIAEWWLFYGQKLATFFVFIKFRSEFSITEFDKIWRRISRGLVVMAFPAL
jgi:hypothetical protein